MTRSRKPSSKSARPADKTAARAPSNTGARTVTRSVRGKTDGTPAGTGSIGRDGKLHIQPGSVRKPKTDGRPTPAGRRGPPDTTATTEAPVTGRRPSKAPNPPRLRGPQLDAPAPGTIFRDRDGKPQTFPDSALKRIAAQILTTKNKKWRYRPFSFPIFTPSGNEQEMHFDFYVYDNMDSVVRLILLMPRESREVWDRVGRFKQQYPMYTYELWTPDALAKILAPRGGLGW